MKITLLNTTESERARNLLIYTKQTRLGFSAARMEDVEALPEKEKMSILQEMARTIPSSWEFIDYTFELLQIPRALAQQIERTRTGSYAEQTWRVVDVRDATYSVGPSINKSQYLLDKYGQHMQDTLGIYSELVDKGAATEDARGVIGMNFNTNLIAKFNLRTLAEMALKRSGPRTQGHYHKALTLMLEEVVKAHPWARVFFQGQSQDAASRLEEFIKDQPIDDVEKARLFKAVDLIKQGR